MDAVEPKRLTILARELRAALSFELDTKLKAEHAEFKAEQARVAVLIAALAEFKIDGKNASARSLQEAQVLADSMAYQAALAAVREAKEAAGGCEVARRYAEARISLTRAWLCAQRPDL